MRIWINIVVFLAFLFGLMNVVAAEDTTVSAPYTYEELKSIAGVSAESYDDVFKLLAGEIKTFTGQKYARLEVSTDFSDGEMVFEATGYVEPEDEEAADHYVLRLADEEGKPIIVSEEIERAGVPREKAAEALAALQRLHQLPEGAVPQKVIWHPDGSGLVEVIWGKPVYAGWTLVRFAPVTRIIIDIRSGRIVRIQIWRGPWYQPGWVTTFLGPPLYQWGGSLYMPGYGYPPPAPSPPPVYYYTPQTFFQHFPPQSYTSPWSISPWSQSLSFGIQLPGISFRYGFGARPLTPLQPFGVSQSVFDFYGN